MNEATIATQAAVSSPAEDEYDALDDGERTMTDRMSFIENYGYAVFTRRAARCVARHAPVEGVLSAGAGGGYDASVIRDAGVDVRAVDIDVPEQTWTEVEEADAVEVAAQTKRALYLAWPPRNAPVAERVLDAYDGDVVFYAGESAEYDPSNEGFHDLLAEEWRVAERVDLPTWPGTNDDLTVHYRR